jgi:hypothetical protein
MADLKRDFHDGMIMSAMVFLEAVSVVGGREDGASVGCPEVIGGPFYTLDHVGAFPFWFEFC